MPDLFDASEMTGEGLRYDQVAETLRRDEMKGAKPALNIVGHEEMHISRDDYDAHMRYVKKTEAEVERLREECTRMVDLWEKDVAEKNVTLHAATARAEREERRARQYRETLTSAYSMLSLMRYRSPASFDGSPGLPDIAEADTVLAKCRAALAPSPDADARAGTREAVIAAARAVLIEATSPHSRTPYTPTMVELENAFAVYDGGAGTEGGTKENPYRDAALLLANLTDWVEGERWPAEEWYERYWEPVRHAVVKIQDVEPDYPDSSAMLLRGAENAVAALDGGAGTGEKGQVDAH